MTHRNGKPEHPEPGLFDSLEPSITLKPSQSAQLETLVEALLAEIVAALAKQEASNEQQDHH
jgi:hypothetical protein